MDIDSIRRQAADAGSTIGNTHKRLRSLITEMSDAGINDYTASEHKEARKAFAEAAVAGGASKNSGMTLYARAYDSLIADGNTSLQPRPRKGAGGKPGSGDDASSGTLESVPDAKLEPTLTNEEAIAQARPFIEARAIRAFMIQHGFDALLTEAAQVATEVKDRSETVKHALAKKLIADMLAAITTLGTAAEKALTDAHERCATVGLHDDEAVAF